MRAALFAVERRPLLGGGDSLPRPLERSSIREVMRVKALILALILAFGSGMCSRAKFNLADPTASAAHSHKPAPAASSKTPPAKVDFNTQVRPLLESRCTPCHFAGGKMYERLPFDRPATIKALGTKLFSRIKEEKEQRLIREFLAQ